MSSVYRNNSIVSQFQRNIPDTRVKYVTLTGNITNNGIDPNQEDDITNYAYATIDPAFSKRFFIDTNVLSLKSGTSPDRRRYALQLDISSSLPYTDIGQEIEVNFTLKREGNLSHLIRLGQGFTSDSNNVITNAIEWSNFRYSFYSNRNTSAVFIFTGTHYVIKSMGSGLNLDQVIYD
jgi:hypothetical protein